MLAVQLPFFMRIMRLLMCAANALSDVPSTFRLRICAVLFCLLVNCGCANRSGWTMQLLANNSVLMRWAMRLQFGTDGCSGCCLSRPVEYVNVRGHDSCYRCARASMLYLQSPRGFVGRAMLMR
jgi:hypothetical protein